MTRLVIEAVNDAGVDKKDIQSLIFTVPRPYTLQKYFHTFLVSHLRLPCVGTGKNAGFALPPGPGAGNHFTRCGGQARQPRSTKPT